jgi:hypothetical protein
MLLLSIFPFSFIQGEEMATVVKPGQKAHGCPLLDFLEETGVFHRHGGLGGKIANRWAYSY